jgi:hypothetical protein
MFAADGKVYGIEAEKMTFNEFGKYKSTKESKNIRFYCAKVNITLFISFMSWLFALCDKIVFCLTRIIK